METIFGNGPEHVQEEGVFMAAGSLLRRAVACLLIAGLAGCGGGGSSTGGVPGPGETAGVTSGIAVDPYIKGAKFQEILANGVEGQTSSESDDNGKFTFEKALAQGSTIIAPVVKQSSQAA